MKYVFIENHQAEFSIKALCRVINARQRFRQDCDIAVSDAFTQAKQRYGAPCLADELREQGLTCNVKTIASSLRRQGLRAKASRRFSPVSYSEHGLPVSENLLKQDFSASGPNQKRCGDITYLRTELLPFNESGMCSRRTFCQPGNNADNGV